MKNLSLLIGLIFGALIYSQSTIAQCGATSVTADPQPIMICEGNAGVVNFTPTGTCGGTYQYQVQNGATIVQAWSATASYSASPTSTTTYTVYARCSSCTGTVVSTTFTVDVVEEPTISGNLVVCPGDNTTLTASGSTGNFEWYDAAVPGTLLSATGVYTTPALGADQTYWVHVTGTVAGGGGSILITECGLEGAVGGTGSEDYIEVSNLYTTAINTTGWVVAVSSSYTVINSFNATLWNLPNSFPACSMQARTDNAASGEYWGNNIFWNPGSSSWAIIIDDVGNVVDFVAWGWTAAQIATFNPTINGFPITLGAGWTGNGCPAACGTVGGVQYSLARTGSTDNNNAGDFVCQPTSVNLVNPGMSCGWTTGLTCPYPATVVVDLPPTASNPAPINVECSADVPAANPAVVTSEADDFTWPLAVTHIGDVSNGLTCPETIIRTYRVTDACGSFVDVTQTITIQDVTDPVFSAPPIAVTVDCIGNVPAMTSLGYTDNCDPNSTVLGVDGALVGGNCGGTITRTWTFTDLCGNSDTETQIITVDDNTAPNLAAAPGDVSVQCPGDVPAMISLAYTDNCDPSSTILGVDGPLVGGNCGGTITRTWTISDACGNTSTDTQVITINDNTAPVLAAAPADVTVDCLGNIPAMISLGYTDNCDAGSTVLGSDGALVGGACGGTITRTWTISDACGNTSTDTQIITVDDNTAPVLAAAPADVTVDCLGNIPAMIDLAYTDNCDPGSTVTGVDGALIGGACGGTITRTWTISDACGNVSTDTQVITVDDNTAPVLAAAPADVTVDCLGNIPAMIDLAYTDNCDPGSTVTGVDGALIGGACGGTITRTWTISDACGNTSTDTQVITVDDNTAPVLAAAPGDVSVQCPGDVPPMISLAYTDNCDPGSTVLGVDGPLVGGNCGGTITRTWTISDACGNTSTDTQIITINDDTNPTASNPLPIVVPGGVAPAVDITVVFDELDNCTVAPVVTLFSESTNGGTCPEIITRIYRVTDECGNFIDVTQTITIGDAILPTASDPLPINVECDVNVPLPDPLVVTDESDNGATPIVIWEDDISNGATCPEVILRRYRVTDDCGNFIFVTQTITIHDVTDPVFAAAPIAVTVDCFGNVPAMTALGYTDNCDPASTVMGTDGALVGGACGGTITRTWTFSDLCGNTATATQIITVDDNTAPVLAAAPLGVTVECIGDVPPMIDLAYTDNCDPGSTVTGVDGALVGGTCGGTITRTWTISDACGNTSTDTQIITVDDNTAPVLAAAPGPVSVQCPGDVPPMISLAYTDNCDPGSTVLGVDGPLVGGNCGGTITRTWTISDICGNTTTDTQIITIDDTTLPTASDPLTTTVPGGPAPAPDVTVVIDEMDNCTVAPIVALVSNTTDGANCPETITHIYSVTDVCGNSINVTHIILITDPIMPTADLIPPVSYDCIGDVPAADITVVQNEADNNGPPVVTWDGDVSDNGSCPETITRTYRVTDACANFILITQIITVHDLIDPVFATAPIAVTVDCFGNVPAMTALGYTDNCDPASTVMGTDGALVGGACGGTITRTWTFSDVCGNTATTTQIITVDDNTAPVLAAAPLGVTVECIGDVPPMTDLAYTDNCDPGSTVTGVDGALIGGTCGGTITRTWTISDACGNTSTDTQIITVDDNTAPVLAAAPGPVSVQCPGDVPPMISLAYTDNCDPGSTVLGVDGPLVGGNCGGTITRTWTISDICGNTTTDTQIITIDDTTLPTASDPLTTTIPGGPAPAPDVTVVLDEMDNCTVAPIVAVVSNTTDGGFCPETITHVYSVTDACGNSINVTHIILITDPIMPTADPLAPVSYNCIGDVPVADPAVVLNEADNNGTPVVTWISDVSDNGNCPETITRTYRVTDVCGNAIDIVQIITINVTAGPVVPANDGSTIECLASAVQPAAPVVTDQCGNNVVAVITENVDPICEGDKVYTYTYTDCAGNISVYTYTYTLDVTTFPVVPLNAGSTVECMASITIPTEPVVMDVCGNNIVAVMTENADPICEGDKIYTFTYTDCAGNASVYTYTYTIDVVTSPVVPTNHQDFVQCIGDVFIPPAPVVTDVCGNNIVAVMTENTDPICTGDKVYTFTYTDCAGNASVYTYTFTVNDNTNPTASNPMAISVPGSMNVPAADILVVIDEADNCTTNPTVAWISDVSDGNVCNGEIITRTYSVTDDCGNSIIVTQLITIEAIYPPIDAGPDQLICAGEQVTLTAGNPMGVPIVWDNGITDNVPFSPAVTTMYTVTADNLGCISTDQASVTVEPLPVINFSGDVLSGCDPLTVTFTNNTAGVLENCVWDMNGVQLSGCANVTHVFNSAGLYDVTLTTTSVNGCTSSDTYTDYIYVEAIPVASFIPSENEIDNLDSQVSFDNTSIDATDYSWDFGDASTSTVESPTHTFPSDETATFIVQLVATSPLGCADTAYTTIQLNEEVIYYVPNTFTPDDDDYNPTFLPVFTSGYDPYDFTLLLFNRWGEIMFESHDSSVGWDGTYNGELVQDGIYSWKIEFKTKATDERRVVVGHVNLMR